MRYRKLDANGDYTFGHQQADFLRDSPEAVAQAVETRLKLWTGEWFLDTTEGTPWLTEILGTGTTPTYDNAIRQRILGTPGVLELVSYSSSRNTDTRALQVNATISTAYGTATIEAVM